MNTTAIQDLTPEDVNISNYQPQQQQPTPGIGRLSDPIVIEKGKGELPNVSYAPLDIHPNPFLSGITEVNQGGPTNPLPSRDIPKNTVKFAQDEEILPNYIPAPSRRVLVDEITESDKEQFRRKKYRKRIWDDVWEQIQIPFLVSLLYFVLNMPFFENLFHLIFFQYFPMLFHSTGLINTYGLIVKAGLFGAAYTGMMMVVQLGGE